MKLSELKRHNYLSVYNAIAQGNDTHSKILKSTGISRYTISEITNDLVKRNLLEMSIPKRDEIGRRVNRYKPSNNYYCLFIDKQENFFSTIGINTSGLANIRFDFNINYNGLSPQEVFDQYVMNEIKSLENFEFCMAIYLINGDDINVQDDIIKTTKEDLIIDSLIEPSKMILFEINNQCIMSLYGHLHYSNDSKYTLCEHLNFDEIISLQGNLYFEAFNALKVIAIKNLSKII